MPTLTINGQPCEFTDGSSILQVALDHEIEIPHYCYHPALSVVANCRICLAEVWQPNPRDDGALELLPKLVPTCQTMAAEGQVIHTDSPKAIANQKSVMEFLLINHPVDCPVCDQAGECYLQDYSYQYGRGGSRFQEVKIKQPKKDVGEHVLLYSDRCIMCTVCVRFTEEITGTGELMVDGRGAQEQINIFPGHPLANELSANVIDLCPVGALLDKDFLFQQRVWYLRKTPSIDGLTASGDNISIEHNDGRIYRIKPRTNLDVNRYWITDEVRYGWKFIHSEDRLRIPRLSGEPAYEFEEAALAWETALQASHEILDTADTIGVLMSPMLSCEDAFALVGTIAGYGGDVIFGIGPVPVNGEDKVFNDGFRLHAEKAPNARGVRRVLSKCAGEWLDFESFLTKAKDVDALLLTGNYPSYWATDALLHLAEGSRTILLDTLDSPLCGAAQAVLPSATFAEKSGTFENADSRLQAFDRAIDPVDYCKSEAQIALDLRAVAGGKPAAAANPADLRSEMAAAHGLDEFCTDVHLPLITRVPVSDMEIVDL